MKYNPEIHHRHTIRLQNFDYSTSGAYFITICTENHLPILGEIGNNDANQPKIILNEYGILAHNEWLKSSKIRPDILLDQFVIMPDHMHGIIFIIDYETTKNGRPAGRPYKKIIDITKYGANPNIGHSVGVTCRSPLENITPFVRGPKPRSIGAIIAGFKSAVTKRINQIRQTPFNPVWQRNYYEHIIRNENELTLCRKYILENPLNYDKNHPDQIPGIPSGG